MSTHTNENDPAMPNPEKAITIYDDKGKLAGTMVFNATNGLTAREQAALVLRVPMSGNKWLDAMITEARRWDAAQAAMQGDISGGGFDPERIIKCSEEAANALTRQMKGESK